MAANLREPAGRARNRVKTSLILVALLAASGCSRGPAPPRPTEDLIPTVVGAITGYPGPDLAQAPPFELEGDGQFGPGPGAVVRRLKNWPPDREPADIYPGALLLGGKSRDGSWWYEIAD